VLGWWAWGRPGLLLYTREEGVAGFLSLFFIMGGEGFLAPLESIWQDWLNFSG
jgi:hypothetical protein